MERKGISLAKSSVALTLLSLAEFITYVLASVLGDNLKGRLIYANVVSSSCLSVICIAWPFVDVDYVLILTISLGYSLCFLKSVLNWGNFMAVPRSAINRGVFRGPCPPFLR